MSVEYDMSYKISGVAKKYQRFWVDLDTLSTHNSPLLLMSL